MPEQAELIALSELVAPDFIEVVEVDDVTKADIDRELYLWQRETYRQLAIEGKAFWYEIRWVNNLNGSFSLIDRFYGQPLDRENLRAIAPADATDVDIKYLDPEVGIPERLEREAFYEAWLGDNPDSGYGPPIII